MPPAPASRRWLWAAIALTAAKLWLTGSQTIHAIGPALHDDRLFVRLAARLLDGQWLGPYDQFTLAKGPLFPLFIAGVFQLGLPLLLAQQTLYAGACAAVTRALAPWLRTAWVQFSLYAVLLLNPMSWDAGHLSRLMRQNLATPLALLVVAGLIQWFARRRESGRRQAGPAALAGLCLGGFWLTREESVWLLPAVALLLAALAWTLRGAGTAGWRPLAAGLGVFLSGYAAPLLAVSTLNLRHYGWFGTVEFRAGEFQDAYGALTRLRVGPPLPQVPVTREMREAAYAVSPTFAQLQPHLEGAVGDHWIERNLFPAAERQIRGGWFIWALRDAMTAAGLAPDAGTALRNYRRLADEINAAADAGRVPAGPRRSGFLPPLGPELARPLRDGAIECGAYFILFRGFTAYSPDSIGDYADLKPFRDLVGTRLSHAPRSPDPAPPTQSALDSARLGWLDQLGRALARAFACAGPILLLVGLVRLGEAVLDRRAGFLLGLAASLLAACAAYLAINVLVHVTSFHYLSPAAMASAYPLYLLALGAIAVDALRAWGQPAAAAPRPPGRPSPRWLVPAGAMLTVFAARLREIHLYGGDVPFNDQWIIEAWQLIAPWLDGTLRPWDFLRPHFEHVPLWTRLLAWLEVVVTGVWDPRLQMTVNAGLYVGFVGLFTRWVWRSLAPGPAGFVTLVLAAGASLPHAWENIAWGFQSQFPFALLFLFVHVHGSVVHAPGSRAWWAAQAAGAAGLFTLASMWLAPLAVLAVHLWTRRRDRRAIVAPAVIAAAGLAILGLVHGLGPAGHAFAQTGRSPLALLHALLHLLGWPSGLPGAAAAIHLPWLIHALRLRGRADAPAADRIICALGAWSVAQTAGLAFARAGDTGDYVSRHGDVLFVGILAGALALTRLVPPAGRARPLFLAAAAAWGGLVGTGLLARATEGHARHFHQTAAQAIELRRTAVQAYLRDGDRGPMEKPETRWVLTQSTDVLASLLDRPDFRALLPASVNPAAPDRAVSAANRRLQSAWAWLLAGGLGLLGAGLVLARLRGTAVAPPAPPAPRPDPWPLRLALGVAVAAGASLFLWRHPLTFDREFRWRQALGGAAALPDLSFVFATPSPFGPERLQGAAPLSPVELRNRFFGTAPAGPNLTATVLSSPFRLTHPWMVVPYAGHPTAHGNGLRLQILDDSGREVVTEIDCPGPNLDRVAYWTAPTRAHLGRLARLVLYDGRTDTEAWVAVAPPIPTDDPELAVSLARRLQQEEHAGLHASLAAIALVALAGSVVAWRGRRRASASADPPAV